MDEFAVSIFVHTSICAYFALLFCDDHNSQRPLFVVHYLFTTKLLLLCPLRYNKSSQTILTCPTLGTDFDVVKTHYYYVLGINGT